MSGLEPSEVAILSLQLDGDGSSIVTVAMPGSSEAAQLAARSPEELSSELGLEATAAGEGSSCLAGATDRTRHVKPLGRLRLLCRRVHGCPATS